MSGVASASRQAAQTGSRQGWLASLRDEALSFVKGDNNAPWAILAETVIGCVPVLGQIVDARDIIKGLMRSFRRKGQSACLVQPDHRPDRPRSWWRRRRQT